MSRLEQVQNALGQAIADAINAYGFTNPPGQVFPGFPTVQNLTDILHAGKYCISIYPHSGTGAKPMKAWYPEPMQVSAVVNTLTASVSGNVITFGGSAMPNINVHTLFNHPEVVVAYKTTASDTVPSVASAVATAINNAHVAGVSATANANAVTLIGATNLHVNLSGTAQIAQEVRRLCRRIQVDTWCPDFQIRDTLDEIITSNVGTLINSKYDLGDGTTVWVKYVPGAWDDARESADLMYRGIYLFDCEYSVLQYQTATQIASTQTTYTFGPNSTQETIIEG